MGRGRCVGSGVSGGAPFVCHGLLSLALPFEVAPNVCRLKAKTFSDPRRTQLASGDESVERLFGDREQLANALNGEKRLELRPVRRVVWRSKLGHGIDETRKNPERYLGDRSPRQRPVDVENAVFLLLAHSQAELRKLGELLPPHSALDGEIVIELDGKLEFDAMQNRLHPAESRIRKLSAETPARYIVFDILLWNGEPIHERPLAERRKELERLAKGFSLSPISKDPKLAKQWLERLEMIGLDGVIAKRVDLPYKPGARDAVSKVKHHRTCDCVIVGYRTSGKKIASLLLGLYRDDGTLDFVGHTSGIAGPLQAQLQQMLPPLLKADQHIEQEWGRTPEGGSRWSQGKDLPWHEIRPEVVCEVRFDKMEQERFRHGTRFLRFRPDKDPKQCTWEQVKPTPQPGDPRLDDLLAGRLS